MTDHIDLKYINILENRLDRFSEKSSDLYCFRCPFCGDSKKSKNKARGYLKDKDDYWSFNCFNCGHSTNLYGLLKHVDNSLCEEYNLEKFRSKGKSRTTRSRAVQARTLQFSSTKEENVKEGIIPPINYDISLLYECININSLSNLSPYKRYVTERQIPEQHWDKLFYCPDFKALVNKLVPGKLGPETLSEERLAIPYFDERGKVFAVTGRSFKQYTKMRYMNLLLDKTKRLTYGLDRLDKTKEILVVEGPLDSLFLSNCIAMSGTDNVSGIHELGVDKSDIIIVFDKEYKNKEIYDRMVKMIDDGYRVCIWPKTTPGKDINEMVLKGLKPLDIERIIRENTFLGLRAKLELAYRK